MLLLVMGLEETLQIFVMGCPNFRISSIYKLCVELPATGLSGFKIG